MTVDYDEGLNKRDYYTKYCNSRKNIYPAQNPTSTTPRRAGGNGHLSGERKRFEKFT